MVTGSRPKTRGCEGNVITTKVTVRCVVRKVDPNDTFKECSCNSAHPPNNKAKDCDVADGTIGRKMSTSHWMDDGTK